MPTRRTMHNEKITTTKKTSGRPHTCLLRTVAQSQHLLPQVHVALRHAELELQDVDLLRIKVRRDPARQQRHVLSHLQRKAPACRTHSQNSPQA